MSVGDACQRVGCARTMGTAGTAREASHRSRLGKLVAAGYGREDGCGGRCVIQRAYRLAPRWLLVGCWLSALAASLVACSVHTGGDALAFVRSGQLWTIQDDGTNKHQLASGAIVSFAWSP